MPEGRPGDTPRRAFIGDVHGCFDELCDLFEALGFGIDAPAPGDRIDEVWLVGDLVNTGPKVDRVLALVARLLAQGRGGFVLGNHDENLLRAIEGDPAQAKRTRVSLEQIDAGNAIDRPGAQALLQAAPLERRFADSDLLLVHASPIDPSATAAEQRHAALYGPTGDGRDARGKPLRVNWPRCYAGPPFVVFGHSPHRKPARFAHAICLDTGCVYGGTLTAWLPHQERCVAVPARRAYAKGYVRSTQSDGPHL
jgi:protein phosphatase